MLLTPFPEYKLSARIMNNFHLPLSLRHVKKIRDGIKYPKGYSASVPVALWKDSLRDLLLYARELLRESKSRGLKDPKDWSWIDVELGACGPCDTPWWLGNKEWHSYHRGLLHKQDEAWYTSVYVKTKAGIRFDEKYNDVGLIFSEDKDIYARERTVAALVNKESCRG